MEEDELAPVTNPCLTFNFLKQNSIQNIITQDQQLNMWKPEVQFLIIFLYFFIANFKYSKYLGFSAELATVIVTFYGHNISRHGIKVFCG